MAENKQEPAACNGHQVDSEEVKKLLVELQEMKVSKN